MRTKRFPFLVVAALAVVLLATLVFVACDPNEPSNNEDKYAVTFDIGEATEGGITAPPAQQVEQGQSLTLPSMSWEGHVFLGWSDGEQQYDEGASYTPQSDVTLKAVWGGDEITGSGTDEDPYMINTANALITFAYNVNHPDVEETENWYKACFALGADIDMTGKDYIPAGSRATKTGTDDNGNDIIDILGFQGKFDGRGHTISNLTIDQTVPGEAYLGLFGYTLQAYLHDVKLKNVNIRATAGANSADIKAFIGALAGYLCISQIDCIEAELNVKMRWLPLNLAGIGGIAGTFHSDSGYIAYAENIKSNFTLEIESFETGSNVSVLDSAYSGGLFGQLYVGGSSAAALVNVSSDSNIEGGKALGGLIGYASGDNLSIINAYAKSILKPTATVSGTEKCYAGGIAGLAASDALIMDSYADVTVQAGRKATYIGGIVGLGSEDDFYCTQTYGVGAVNSYYKLNSDTTVEGSNFGEEASSALDKEFATQTLKWNEQSWDFDAAVPTPTSKRARDINEGKYTVTFKDGEKTTSQTYDLKDDGQNILGELDDAENTDNNVFWDWQHADGIDYRYYLPVVKDMTLTAKRVDVSDMVALYEGNSEYSGHINYIGIIELKDKGEVDYINSSSGTSSKGNFYFDGEHIIIETVDNDSMCGTLQKNDDDKYEIQWVWQEGTGYEVVYTFVQAEGITLAGEYFSDNGDIITFTGSANLTVLLDGFDSAVQATFTSDGNMITVFGLENYFTSATIENITSGGFKTNFVGKDGRAGNNLNYRKIDAVDCSDQPFIGENYVPYMSNEYYEMRTITFKKDGTLTSSFSSAPGRFYVFGTKVKMILDSYVSTFNIVTVGGANILVGVISRGGTARCSTVVVNTEYGMLRAYILNKDRNDAVFVNDKGSYYVKNGELQADAQISGEFADGKYVTLNGAEYLVSEGIHSENERLLAYTLSLVGTEKGNYSYNGKSFALDGVSRSTGEIEAPYVINGKYVVVFDCETGYLLVFDHAAARAANGTVTEAKSDGYRGIYFGANADEDKYYALIFDGVGKSIMCSHYGGDYDGIWGDEWSAYTIRDNGDVFVQYNEYQKPVFSFYYDNQMVYANKDSDSNMFKDKIFTALDYEGSTDIPTFDAAGTYTGNGVELEIKADLKGTLNGKAFTAHIDSNNVITFTVENIKYTFDASDADNITLTGGSYRDLKLAKAQTGGDSFSIVGKWTGKSTSTANYYKDVDIAVEFRSDNKLTLQIGEGTSLEGTYSWDVAKKELKVVSGIVGKYIGGDNFSIDAVKFTVTDTNTVTIAISMTYDDMTEFTVTSELEQDGAGSETGPFPQGTWKGDASVDGPYLQGGEMTLTFKSDGTFEISVSSLKCSGTYTCEGQTITVKATGGSYNIEELSIEFKNGSMSVNVTFYDDDSMSRWRFTAETLTQA